MTPAERLMLARENIEEAKLLYGEHIGSKVVFTKLYHALMYCLFALFDVRIIGNLTHADIIERFDREYVKPGVLGGNLLNVIRRAYDLTHECDCDHMPVPIIAEGGENMKITKVAKKQSLTCKCHSSC